MEELTKTIAELVTLIKNNTETQDKLATQVDLLANALYKSLCVVETLRNRVIALEKQIKS